MPALHPMNAEIKGIHQVQWIADIRPSKPTPTKNIPVQSFTVPMRTWIAGARLGILSNIQKYVNITDAAVNTKHITKKVNCHTTTLGGRLLSAAAKLNMSTANPIVLAILPTRFIKTNALFLIQVHLIAFASILLPR
jgi:hypothetical protein